MGTTAACMNQNGYAIETFQIANSTNLKYYVHGLISVLIFCFHNSFAQYTKTYNERPNKFAQNVAIPSSIKSTECSSAIKVDLKTSPWLTNVKNLERKSFYSSDVISLKSKKTTAKLNDYAKLKTQQTTESNNASSNVTIASNFKGNIFNGGAPPDNTIAVSKNGIIVSVINCNVAYYNTNGNQLWIGSFWELFNDPSLTELIYDPIVIYDSQADRFVMIAIHGFTSQTSKLIISFSKTNNPTEGWWIYKLSGNPLNNSNWLDYPKLGISNNEIYVTGNLFNDFTGFSQAVIYQITKINGYDGLNLNWRLWSNIQGSPITLIPASYGQTGNYGPGLYFVNQSPASGNSVELYELTDDLENNPKLTRTTVFKSDYETSGYAQQAGTPVQLVTGDCRIMNAFYLDGIIHYVFQYDYQSTNYTGINYNRLNVNTLAHESFTYGKIGFDFAYPTIASYATSESDKTVIVCFLNSGPTIFPETRAVVFNENKNWSNDVLIKSGLNYVDAFQFDNLVRWGDYTGISYKHNTSTPEVWLSGCYGSTQNLFNTSYKCFNTWIAQVNNLVVGTNEFENEKKNLFTIYPNPIIDFFSIDFEIADLTNVRIDIHDLSGKTINTLFNGMLKKGKNNLTFNKNALNPGVYLLTIRKNDQLLKTEKIIIE